MKISLNWLTEFVDLPTRNPGELSRVLAMLGHEVEGVETVEAGWNGVQVARVETVEPHPDADKVRVCTVSAGGDRLTVVCGAWNFQAGALVAFAQPGAMLPGDFEIGVRSIRGVESHGMICSEKELDLGEDAAGILVLEPDAKVGEPLEAMLALPDVIFDLTITTNRPDAMSVYGIARDLAAWYERPLERPDPRPPTVPGPAGITVEVADPKGNPRFVARRIDGVEVAPAPLWMRYRLRTAGIRPISNLVDVTNYVMLELGQPLHVFDTDTVADQHLIVRRADTGETLVTLDGIERRLSVDDLVICDSGGPTSLSGTMGGERSEVSASTGSVIIEAASWHAPTILNMSRRHGLRTEASARFERGVDPSLPPLASLRAAELILTTAGGELREQWVDELAHPLHQRQITLPVGEVNRLLGSRFETLQVGSILDRLGFTNSGSDPIQVTVPSYRPDVTRPVDLVEEVARLAGYDTFGERLRVGRGGGLTFGQRLTRRLREILVDAGYSQSVTLPFLAPGAIEAFDPPSGHELTETVVVKNPLSDEESVLRTSLLPGLLEVLRHNRSRGRDDVAVFEQGRVFHARPWILDRRVPSQPNRLGVAATGVVGPSALDGKGPPADVHSITAVLRHLASTLGLDLSLTQGSAPGYHPTRTALVTSGDEPIGYLGELHPLTARAFDLEGRVAVMEVDLDGLVGARREPDYRPISPYPPADFDLSFEVPRELPSTELVEVVEEAGGELVEWVRIFDEFLGGSLPVDRKALAMRVRLRAPDRTLQASEIAGLREAMISSAARVDAALRGGS